MKTVTTRVLSTLFVSAIVFVILEALPHLGVNYFKEESDKLIILLLFSILFNVVHFTKDLENNLDKNEKSLKSNIHKIVEFLKVDNEYFNNDWLYSIFDRIADIIKDTDRHKQYLGRVKMILEKAISESKGIIGSPDYKENLDELNRILLIKHAQEVSKTIIHAVTIDVRNYYRNFWQDNNLFEKSYIIANNFAAKNHGAVVQRIFVMDNEVLNGTSEKAKHFKKTVLELKKGGKNVSIYFLDIEKYKRIPNMKDTSFFLADDEVASESGMNEDNGGGNFSLNQPETYNSLKNRFEIMLSLSKQI